MHSASAQPLGFLGIGTSQEDAPGSYSAGIWVDPDGCQHWVMDLGIEGMMDSVLGRNGKPVCGRSCGAISGDVLFASGSSSLTSEGRSAIRALATQLQATNRTTVGVIGYTDSDGSEAANQRLSQARANAVAGELRASGVNVSSTSGAGESNPIASNATADGKAQNRRVELTCN